MKVKIKRDCLYIIPLPAGRPARSASFRRGRIQSSSVKADGASVAALARIEAIGLTDAEAVADGAADIEPASRAAAPMPLIMLQGSAASSGISILQIWEANSDALVTPAFTPAIHCRLPMAMAEGRIMIVPFKSQREHSGQRIDGIHAVPETAEGEQALAGKIAQRQQVEGVAAQAGRK